MRPLRICIYGGTDIKGTPSDFIAELSYEILRSFPAIIITGGFHHSNKAPAAISTDVAALRGATRFANESEGFTNIHCCYCKYYGAERKCYVRNRLCSWPRPNSSLIYYGRKQA